MTPLPLSLGPLSFYIYASFSQARLIEDLLRNGNKQSPLLLSPVISPQMKIFILSFFPGPPLLPYFYFLSIPLSGPPK